MEKTDTRRGRGNYCWGRKVTKCGFRDCGRDYENSKRKSLDSLLDHPRWKFYVRHRSMESIGRL